MLQDCIDYEVVTHFPDDRQVSLICMRGFMKVNGFCIRDLEHRVAELYEIVFVRVKARYTNDSWYLDL